VTAEDPGDAPQYALILERESPKPDGEIGRALALHLPVTATDAIARVRYGGGLLVRGISEELAEEIRRSLAAIGVGARIIEAERWGPVPRGRRVTWLSLRGDSMRIRPGNPTGSDLVVPRSRILAIALQGVAPPPPPEASPRKSRLRNWTEVEERPVRRMGLEEALSYREPTASLLLEPGADRGAAGIPSLSPRGAELVRNLSRHGLAGMRFRLKIYAAGEPGIYRLEKDEIDFSCLREQKQEHSLDNFLLLVEEILDFLPLAWNRRSAERFLAELDPRTIHCSKEEEAQNFDRWMLEWARIELEERSRGRTSP
jgi:hypothetical protein